MLRELVYFYPLVEYEYDLHQTLRKNEYKESPDETHSFI